ncbi:MAG: hypothetical protein K0U68_16775 [Gammaproteobacteria bacterium]|nr:hypothetical protein [Gammaproteobacteria bacterium]
MNQFERRQTHCPACKDSFSYRYKIIPEAGDNLIVKTTCPFCKTKLKIDLNPYKRRTIISHKAAGDNAEQETETDILDLPDELPALIDE